MPILLDFNPVVIAAISVAKNNLDAGEEIDIRFIRHLFLNQLIYFNSQFKEKYGDLIICCDSTSWRKEYFPYYKANRAKGKASNPQDWELIYKCLDILIKELRDNFPYKIIHVERAEADDIIAVLADYFSRNDSTEESEGDGFISDAPKEVLIISSDKDFKQLQLYSNVSQYSPMQKKMVVEKNPDLYLIEHIIRGDGGDGVPNILSLDNVFIKDDLKQKSIMAKKLEPLLTRGEKYSQHKTLTEDDVREVYGEEFIPNFRRNKKLVSLFGETPQEIITDIINKYEEATVQPRSKLMNYFIQNQLKNLMSDIGKI